MRTSASTITTNDQPALPEETGQLLTAEQLAEYLHVPVATLYAWRYKGSGPRALRIGRHLRYRSADVNQWLEEQ